MTKRSVRLVLIGAVLMMMWVSAPCEQGAWAGQPFGNNWGKWGPDDQIGTINYITPQIVQEVAGLVKQGKVYRFGHPFGSR